MAATSSKGKKGKKKGQTLNLGEFLESTNGPTSSGTAVVAIKSSYNWAEETEDDEFLAPTEKITLPTAPRAARAAIDPNTIPDGGPFKAYVGNLSYDATEDSLADLFSKLNVKTIDLVEDQGRKKGFGYVEFGDKRSLIEALELSGEHLFGRPLKIDLATSRDRDRGFNDGGGYGSERRGNPHITGEGDDDNDWRGSANRTATDSGYGEFNCSYEYDCLISVPLHCCLLCCSFTSYDIRNIDQSMTL